MTTALKYGDLAGYEKLLRAQQKGFSNCGQDVPPLVHGQATALDPAQPRGGRAGRREERSRRDRAQVMIVLPSNSPRSCVSRCTSGTSRAEDHQHSEMIFSHSVGTRYFAIEATSAPRAGEGLATVQHWERLVAEARDLRAR